MTETLIRVVLLVTEQSTLYLNLLLIFCLFFSACSNKIEPGSEAHIREVTLAIEDQRLLNAEDTPGDWLLHGRNYKEDRFSSLNQINKSNIDQLGLAWSIQLGTKRGIEASPLVVDGIMFFTGTWSVVYAVDVRKGEIIWIHDPGVPREYGEKACCDVVNRGVALYKGLVISASLDGRLFALDAATGKVVWEVITVDQKKAYTITGAPRVFDGKVAIGNGGGEYGVRGYVTAYDAMTGDELWRFYTVPGNPADGFENEAMEKAAETWTGEWWIMGGGGTCWDALVYDPELDLLYIGVGNGSPWNREHRSPGGGDNLYLASIVALKPDTGEYVWHYQTTPGDTWDYTATQPIILADLEINSTDRKVLMQAPKNGFFYVLDRITGELISAEAYSYTNWATHIDSDTGRPVESEFARYLDANVTIAPGPGGAHNWHPMSYNPETGLVYIPVQQNFYTYGPHKDFSFDHDSRVWNLGTETDAEKPLIKDEKIPAKASKLVAWDPVNQKEKWNVLYQSTAGAGTLTTPDFVFQGTPEGLLVAYDSLTGEGLWSFDLKSGIIAPSVTYMVDGIQYLTIAVGWGGATGTSSLPLTEQVNPGTIYTFALGKKSKIPDFARKPKKQLVKLPVDASEAELEEGQTIFIKNCRACHWGEGNVPDLTYSTPEIFQIFHEIVGRGIFIGKGMPNYGDRYTEDEISNVKKYILSVAEERRTAQQ